MTPEERLIASFERRVLRRFVYVVCILAFLLGTALIYAKDSELSKKLTPESMGSMVGEEYSQDDLGRLFSYVVQVSEIKAKALIVTCGFAGATGFLAAMLMLDFAGRSRTATTVSLIKRVKVLESKVDNSP